VVKGPAADATDAPQPWGLLCNPVMKMKRKMVVSLLCNFSERWSTGGWHETDREKSKYSGKNLSHCHSVHHKSHIGPGLPLWEAGLRHGTACYRALVPKPFIQNMRVYVYLCNVWTPLLSIWTCKSCVGLSSFGMRLLFDVQSRRDGLETSGNNYISQKNGEHSHSAAAR
jgi:hypothetical protein